MRKQASFAVALLVSLFVILPAGVLLYLAVRPCPDMYLLLPAPGTVSVCDWWDITCHRCH